MSDISAQKQTLAMIMNPVKGDLKPGELPAFQVVLKNSSSEPLKFCRYKLDYRLKAAMVVQGSPEAMNYEAQPFLGQKWDLLKADDLVLLAPGESLQHHLVFQDDPIFRFVRRAKQPPVIPSSNGLQGFPSGRYTFFTALSNQVGLYVGQDGVFDGRLEGRKVPEQWPGHTQDCYSGLVEASAQVTFL